MCSGGPVHCGLGEAAVHDHPRRKPRAEVCGAEPDQLTIGVDVVVIAGGIGLGRAQAFGESHQHHPHSRGGNRQVVGRRPFGKPKRRQPVVDLANDGDTVTQVEHGNGGDAKGDSHQRSRHLGEITAEPDHDSQRDHPDRQGESVGLAESSDPSPELLEEVAIDALDPEQLGKLPHDDGQREADDEALENRFRDEVCNEAEPEQPGEQGKGTHHQCQDHGEGNDLLRFGCQVGHGRCGQGRGRRHRPGDEVLRAPKGGVEDQGPGRGVEPDYRRHPGDGGVGQGLGNQHRPHR